MEPSSSAESSSQPVQAILDRLSSATSSLATRLNRPDSAASLLNVLNQPATALSSPRSESLPNRSWIGAPVSFGHADPAIISATTPTTITGDGLGSTATTSNTTLPAELQNILFKSHPSSDTSEKKMVFPPGFTILDPRNSNAPSASQSTVDDLPSKSEVSTGPLFTQTTPTTSAATLSVCSPVLAATTDQTVETSHPGSVNDTQRLASPSEYQRTQASIFTYVNPFEQLSQIKPTPTTTSANTVTTSQFISSPPSALVEQSVPRLSEPSVQSGYGASSGLFSQLSQKNTAIEETTSIQRHHSPLMLGSTNVASEYSARRLRERYKSRPPKGIPSGLRLPAGEARIDISASNLAMISANDLEVTTITLMPTELELRWGSTIAATRSFIAYAAKQGKVRVIHQLYGTRALVDGHTGRILDLAFFNPLCGGEHEQRLVTVGTDHRLCIWEFSEPNPMGRDEEIPHQIILKLDGVPLHVDQPRFRRAAWHPSDSNCLACTTDRGELLVFNLGVMLADKDSCHIAESDHNMGAIQLKGHKKPIIDVCFSANGRDIITASEDGTVRLWRVGDMSGECIGQFVPCDNLPVTAARFVENVVDGNVQDERRCLLIAAQENRLIKLMNHDGTQCLQQLSFYADNIPFFNVINYDPTTKTIVLANSCRESLYCIHISLDETPRLVYIVEFPLEYPAVSLAVAPDCSDYEGVAFALCCVQTGAVQQFHIPSRTALPRRWERCQMLSNEPAEMVSSPSSVRTQSSARMSQQLTESDVLRSLLQASSSNAPPERADGTISETPGTSSPAVHVVTDMNAMATMHHRTTSDLAPPDSHGKGKQPKSGSASKASINGASSSKSNATRPVESVITTRDHPAFRSPPLRPRQEAPESEQMLMNSSQMRTLEDNIVSRVGKLLNKELSKREERLERERQSHLTAEMTRIDALLGEFTHRLHDLMKHWLAETIQAELRERILPMIERTVTATVEKTVVASVESVMTQQARAIFTSEAFREPIRQAVQTTVKPIIEETMATCIRDVMLPVWQQSMDSLRQASAGSMPHRASIQQPPSGLRLPFSAANVPGTPMLQSTTPGDLKQTMFGGHPPFHATTAAPTPTVGYAGVQRGSTLFNTVADQQQLSYIKNAISAGRYEEAVHKALEIRSHHALETLFTYLGPNIICPTNAPSRLSQPLLLALLYQLGSDLQHQRDTRITWIQAILMHLNTRDPSIADRCRSLLVELEGRLKSLNFALQAEPNTAYSTQLFLAQVLQQLAQLIQATV